MVKVKDVEKAVEELPETEDLSDVDVGLESIDVVDLYARERFQAAASYQQLSIRASMSRATVKAMESVGNKKMVEQHKTELETAEIQIAHCLRSIKIIDAECSKAKKRMQQMMAEGRDDTTCPYCRRTFKVLR